jgi:kynurenine formamidase
MRTVLAASLVLGSLAVATTAQQPVDFSSYTIVDLTHPYNEKTVYWPTSPSKFKLEQLAYGKTDAGFFYSAYSISTPEHGGTHLDAPIHFSEKGRTSDQIPVAQLIAPAVVIDVSAKARTNADYRLTAEDVRQFERAHGTIKPGSIVLLRTDWSKRWPNKKAYLGDDTPGQTTKLHFPSFGVEAAKLLVEVRKAGAIGLDTPSIDYGPSTDFMVHRIAGAANVPGLENLTNLDQLPPTGAIVIALPMKIERGSGGPLRAVAIVPR